MGAKSELDPHRFDGGTREKEVGEMCETLEQYGLSREDLVHLVEGPWRRLRAVIEKKVIDFHTHNWNVKGIKYLRSMREREKLRQRKEEQNYTEDLILSMDMHGIEKACVQWPKYANWIPHDAWVESLKGYPDRLIESAYWTGHRDPDRKGTVNDAVEGAQFLRNRLQKGARLIGEGIELPNKTHLDPKVVAPIMEVAEEFDVPILLGTSGTSKAYIVMRQPELYLPVLQAYPRVKFVIGDGGGKRFAMGGGWTAVMCASMYENVHFEISGTPVSVVEMAVRTLGADRVLFGSDQSNSEIRYFEPHGQWDKSLQWSNLNAVALANLSEAERDMVLHKNARRLLKLND